MDLSNNRIHARQSSSRDPSRSRTGGKSSQLETFTSQRHAQLSSATTKIGYWNDTSPTNTSDSDGGLIADLTNLVRAYLAEVELKLAIAVNSEDHVSLRPEICAIVGETIARFRLWSNSEHDLDRVLALQPQVRKRVIWNLMSLAVELFQGIKIYTEAMQDTLRQETLVAIEKAANLDVYTYDRSKDPPAPGTIVNFVRLKYQIFKHRVDDLFDVLPTINRLAGNVTADITKHNQVGGQAKAPPNLCRQMPSAHRTSVGQPIHWKHSVTSDGKDDLPAVPYNFDEAHNSTSDTVDTASSESDYAASTESSSSSTVSLGDNAIASTPPTTDSSVTGRELPTGTHQQYKRLKEIQDVWIADPNNCSQDNGLKRRAALDSGTPHNFVQEADIECMGISMFTIPDGGMTHELYNGEKLYTTKYAKPHLHFRKGVRCHVEHEFFVVKNLPNGLSMVIGHKSYKRMGIRLRYKPGALGAFSTGKKGNEVTERKAQQKADGAALNRQHDKRIQAPFVGAIEKSKQGKAAQGEPVKKDSRKAGT